MDLASLLARATTCNIYLIINCVSNLFEFNIENFITISEF